MKTIIGLGFRAHSGKDLAADLLVQEFGYQKTAYAKAIKDACRAIFHFSEDQLYGDKKEEVDLYWNKRIALYNVELIDGTSVIQLEGVTTKNARAITRLPITPRLMFQYLGTNVGRNHFGVNIWIDSMFKEIHDSPFLSWVISDVRYPNEADIIRELGGKVYRIDRPTDENIGGISGHASEISMLNYSDWSGIIDNSKDIAHLYSELLNKVIRNS